MKRDQIKQHLASKFSDDSTILAVDFEAFATNPIYLSEAGFVRIRNGKILATFHTFITPSKSQIKDLRTNPNLSKLIGSFCYVQKITGIPVPWKTTFADCTPQYVGPQYEALFQRIKEFCTSSSAELSGKEGVKLWVEEFDAVSEQSCIFTAKGVDLEQRVLRGILKADWDVVEFEDVYELQYKKAPEFPELHGSRHFDYCTYHATTDHAKAYHCALDDAVYLARLFTGQQVEFVEAPRADVDVEEIVIEFV